MLTGIRFTTLDNKGRSKDVGSALLLSKGCVGIDDLPPDLRENLAQGIVGADQKVYRPADGEKFLQAVLRQFSGPYMHANAIRPDMRTTGGPGSGNFGHGGRPGEQGGSSAGGGGERTVVDSQRHVRPELRQIKAADLISFARKHGSDVQWEPGFKPDPKVLYEVHKDLDHGEAEIYEPPDSKGVMTMVGRLL